MPDNPNAPNTVAQESQQVKSTAPSAVAPELTSDKYEVEVKTADEMSAGTDSNVYLSIHGDKAEEIKVSLKNARNKKNMFEKGKIDKFDLSLKDVGTIKKITLEHDGKKKGSSWKVDHVKIIHKNTFYT